MDWTIVQKVHNCEQNVSDRRQNATGLMSSTDDTERNLSTIVDTDRGISPIGEKVTHGLQTPSGEGVNNNNINNIPYARGIMSASKGINRIGCPACKIGLKKLTPIPTQRAYGRLIIHNGSRGTGLAITREFLLVFSNLGGGYENRGGMDIGSYTTPGL